MDLSKHSFDKESMESINAGFGSFIFQKASQAAKEDGNVGGAGGRGFGDTGRGSGTA
jgi:hypothetical protein